MDGSKLKKPTEPGSDELLDGEVLDKIRDEIIEDAVEQEQDAEEFEAWLQDNKNQAEFTEEEERVDATP